MRRKQEGKQMTLNELLSVFIYRPYDDELSVIVDDNERIL